MLAPYYTAGHVIPSLVRKFCEARENNEESVFIWGTGVATRDFLHVADAAEGIVSAMELYDGADPCNLGSSKEVAIKARTRSFLIRCHHLLVAIELEHFRSRFAPSIYCFKLCTLLHGLGQHGV